MNHEVRTQWHPAFCSAMELNFRENRAQLHFETEHNLSRKPLAVDLLIVRKDGTGELQDPVGRLFARNNLIEYKSPDDAMTIDTLYKVIGYGCLFKSMSPAVNSIPSDEITLTLIRNRYPRRMIEELVKEQISCIQKCPRTQLVITRQLKGKNHLWLRVLDNDLGEDDVKQFVSAAQSVRTNSDAISPDARNVDAVAQVVLSQNSAIFERIKKENVDAVAQVVLSQNSAIFERIKKEDPMMCDALKELMKPEIEESLEKGRQEGRTEGLAEGLAEGGVNALLQIGWAPSRIAAQLHLSEDRVNEIIKKIQSER